MGRDVASTKMGRKFGGLEVSSKESEKHIRDVCQRYFQIRERRLCYMSFILQSKISIRSGSV